MAEESRFAEMQRYLAEQFHEVSKIDFDIGVYSDVLDEANLYSWGYWIKHHCRCIYGEDLATQFMPFSPSKKIAKAVNGDFVEVLNGYIKQIENCRHSNELKLLQRAASRKLLRSTDILRLEGDSDWPESLDDYLRKYTQRYPEQKNRLDYFFAQSLNPIANGPQFVSNLRWFINWLVNEKNKAI
ncbi:nucleotidyltransferase domain-containing protein [Providencia sp. Me31A]|uniref:nucleotidyltransferase domain-containing protein n=1 Tax=Providencia sp. Me31A TaxID=3392637 RepID=UPI003D2E6D10